MIWVEERLIQTFIKYSLKVNYVPNILSDNVHDISEQDNYIMYMKNTWSC